MARPDPKFAMRILVPVVAFISLSLLAEGASHRSAGDKPNIVLIVADDLGYGELGCQGNDEIPTPHIDSIADGGVRFTQGYVSAPFCAASRAGMMTGRYQTRFGFEFNPTGAKNEDPEAGLPVGERTIADELVEAGYVAGIFGKWHLGGTAKYNPIRRGFDEFFGFLHEGHYFVPPPYAGTTTWLRRKILPGGGEGRWTSTDGKIIYSTHLGEEPDYDADNPILRAGQPVEEEAYLTEAITREAVGFIERNADRPFFLYLPYNAVHSPMQATDAYMERAAEIEDIQRRIFAAMLMSLDDGVGEVLGKIEKEGLDRNTVVFFISDNGGPTAELTSSNGLLRDGKGSIYEGGLRVPFLARWDGGLPAGLVYEEPVLSLDVFATAAALAEARLDERKVYDGVNLMPFLKGENPGSPHGRIFWRVGSREAIRDGDWKLVRQGARRAKTEAKWELYDLAEDAGEAKDLAEAHPEKVAELLKAWTEINDEMIDPVWAP